MKLFSFLFSLTFLLLTSCDSSNDSQTSETDILVKKQIWDGITFNFEYDGKKLLKYTSSDGSYNTFTYSGDKIIREDSYGSDKRLIEYFEFSYTNDFLSQIKVYSGSTLTRKFTFVKNSDNTVTRTATSYSGSTSRTVIFKEYYLNENKTKEEQRTSSGSIINTSTFTHDDKNCPTKNILGFKYLNGWYDDNSPNNNILVRTESNSPSSKQTYTYQYNDKGFPTSVIHTVSGFTDNGQFFY